MTTPTPAHQAFRERVAEAFAASSDCRRRDFLAGLRQGFIAGAEAEHEVARTMGAIVVLEAALKPHNRAVIDMFLEENLMVAKEHLAALLAKGGA